MTTYVAHHDPQFGADPAFSPASAGPLTRVLDRAAHALVPRVEALLLRALFPERDKVVRRSLRWRLQLGFVLHAVLRSIRRRLPRRL